MKTINKIILTLPLLGAFFLTGCSRKIEGEAYLNNGNNIEKMSGVEVRVMELDKFQAHVGKRSADMDGEEKRILESITKLKESNNRAKEAREGLFKAQMNVSQMQASGGFNMNSLGGQYMQGQQDKAMSDSNNSMKSINSSIQDVEKSIAASQAEIEAIKSGRSAKFFFPREKLNDLTSVNANSDGKFEVTLNSDKDVVFLVNNNNKYWIIKNTKDEKKLSFTDSNENSSSCDVCIVK